MKALDVMMKDLKIILSDRKALAIMILMPILLVTILGAALKGSFSDGTYIKEINIAVVKKYDVHEDVIRFQDVLRNGIMGGNVPSSDLKEIFDSMDELDLETIFFNDFLGNEELEFIQYKITDEEEAMQLLEGKKISAVVVLPEHFVYDLYINFLTPFRNKVEIGVIGHPDYYLSNRIVEEVIKGFSDILSTMIISKNVFVETSLEYNIGNQVYEDVGILMDLIMKDWQGSEIMIESEKLNGKQPINSFAYYSAAMAAMFILFAAGTGARTLLEEKENFTYQRMKIAGIPKWKILYGKFFNIFIIALIQIGIMIFYTKFILKVYWGNIGTVIIISGIVALSIAGLGILMAVVTYRIGNYKIANLFENAVIQVMALLGGSFIPINVMPKFMHKLSNFTLNGLALQCYLKTMMGYGLTEVLIPLTWLLFIGIIFFVLAIFIMKKEEGGNYVKHTDVENYETA